MAERTAAKKVRFLLLLVVVLVVVPVVLLLFVGVAVVAGLSVCMLIPNCVPMTRPAQLP